MSLLVFGHKNPDTDSICSAISLAHLKNKLGIKATAYALGDIRKEAKYALDYFKVDAPEILDNVRIQVRDLNYDKVVPLTPTSSILEAYNLMDEKNVKTLPVTYDDGTFAGIITMKEIAKNLLHQHFTTIHTSLSNICKNLNGTILVDCGEDVKGRVVTLSFGMETLIETLKEGDIAIVGDRYDSIEYAIDTKVKLLILTNHTEISKDLLALAKINGVSVVSVESDNYKTSNVINQCSFLDSIETTENLITFKEDDYMDEIKEIMLETNFRSYPILDDDNKFLGLISKGHLLNPSKKNVVLVDHNEYAQSADGIEQANIVEIVDHHKLGGISTDVPMSFRVMPVGCNSTIIYQMYKENNVEIPYEIAGLLLSAILSDTLLFKSPTTTDMDKKACEELSKIAKIDMEKYAMDMFKYGTSLDEYTIEEIINMDFKEFNMSGHRVGIGQVFTLDIDSIFSKKDEFLSYINSTDYDKLVLAVTDIIKEGSYLIYKAEDRLIANAFGVEGVQGTFAPGVVSRKKQLVPNLTTAIKNFK
ncbi:putative manganese-dependent inorganic diphosphatase [Clostridioides sp. ES-S-0108-01]|uniref:putative manganese-dependent inorganic diphosphatase n=1 Tax=Clostridioides sp. ES-S-0108-01 TaxID=2770773 RepID=UPI001D0CA6AF|nr:putative manganese-dependent inorganic diphosphatase [Clostridioides sp. ES-S-0108-01]UDN51553.1 putative manganese-dependent inorganic diphosphatase [Clostridioides sp. ES-S-0107-01]